jgi:drug/metabolite transporter (DMT)-like permease
MLLGSLAFATMGALVHALSNVCDWRVIALVRTFLALIFAGTLAWGARAKLVLWRPGTLWLRSIAGSLSLVCTFFAFTRLPVSDVLTLTNTFPIWVGILSWPLLHEPPSVRVWLSVALGIIGIVIMQQPHLAEGNFASLVALASSFSTALAMIGLQRLHAIDTRAIVVHFSGVACLFCVVSLFFFERVAIGPNTLSGLVLLMLLGVGLSATAGQLLLTKAFTFGSPAKISVVGLTQVVFGMVFDTLVWQHSFQPATLLGMGLVLASTAWVILQRG